MAGKSFTSNGEYDAFRGSSASTVGELWDQSSNNCTVAKLLLPCFPSSAVDLLNPNHRFFEVKRTSVSWQCHESTGRSPLQCCGSRYLIIADLSIFLSPIVTVRFFAPNTELMRSLPSRSLLVFSLHHLLRPRMQCHFPAIRTAKCA